MRDMATEREERSLSDVLDSLEATADDGEMRVNDVLGAFGDRSLGAILAMLGLVVMIPVFGSIPGVPTLVAVLVIAMTAQVALGRGALQVPGRLGRASIGRERVESGIERARPWARRVDRVLSERLTVLTRGRLGRGCIAFAAVLLAVTMPPLEVVPWAALAPATGITAFGLALIARDGLFALAGYLLAGLTVFLLATALGGS
ncbi:MAG: exopolysaccharide biosynthesis protein [Paracoccaceae bacterium]